MVWSYICSYVADQAVGLINRFFYFPSLKANGENWSDFIRACHSLEPSRIGQLTAIEMVTITLTIANKFLPCTC